MDKKMKKYKATAMYSSSCAVIIQAESEDQAYQIAKEMDGGSFTPSDDDSSDWRIDRVVEVDSTEEAINAEEGVL